MAETLKGNMVIAQSGGPTVVINQSLVGAVIEARKHKAIQGIFGSLHGLKGILEEEFADLRKESPGNLKAIGRTPSSVLGTARKKPTPEECEQIFRILMKYQIRYFFYIGGNDSAETACILNENAGKVGYELRCFHIPKTIDNDLCENDHTPGYGSAARFVALAIMGDDLDNQALPGVKIDVIMGRNAGFLTAASVFSRQYEDSGPHLIYLPEVPFSVDHFVADVERINSRLGRCLVAVSEGIVNADKVPIAAQFTKEVDSHGNVQLSGTGALGDLLAEQIKTRTGISRVRADTFGYIQRSFPTVYSEVDVREARSVGEVAVQKAISGLTSGSVALKRKAGKKYQVYCEVVALEKVAKEIRPMPPEFINPEGNDVTPAFVEYARPLLGPLPKIARLKAGLVPKK